MGCAIAIAAVVPPVLEGNRGTAGAVMREKKDPPAVAVKAPAAGSLGVAGSRGIGIARGVDRKQEVAVVELPDDGVDLDPAIDQADRFNATRSGAEMVPQGSASTYA